MTRLRLYIVLLLMFTAPGLIYPQMGLYNIHGNIGSNDYIEFVSQNTGWIVTPDYIKKTFDGGTTWTVQMTFDKSGNFDFSFAKDVDFIGENDGYFTMWEYDSTNTIKHFLFKTTDGGDNWIKRRIEVPGTTVTDFTHLTFINVDYGWARINSNDIARTTNGGENWEIVSEDLGNIYKIRFVSQTTGYYYTTGGLHKSTDGGYSWNQLNTGVTNHWDFEVVGDKIWVGADGVYYSSDAGTNWSKISTDVLFGNVSRFQMIDAAHGFAVNNSWHGYFTSDGGVTWQKKSENVGLSSFFDYNNGWFIKNNSLTKAVDNFDSTYTVMPPLEFSDIVIVDELVVLAAALNGAIIRSADGGKTWTLIDDLIGYYITDLCFGEAGNGIAVGYFPVPYPALETSFIARTNDAGESWQLTLANTGATYADRILSADYSNGFYFVKNNGNIIKSDDTGLTWDIDSTDYGQSLYYMKFIGSTGFAIGSYGVPKLFKTVNGGTGWTQISDDSPGSIYYLADDLLWVNFGWGDSRKSTDGGITWINANLDFQNIYFKDQLFGLAYGYLDNGNINSDGTYITNDGGSTWQLLHKPHIGFTRYAIDFHSAGKGFIGNQTSLYTAQRYGLVQVVVSVENPPAGLTPSKFTLLQNYPNPFNPSTKIKYSVSTSETNVRTTLKVYNLLGSEVAVLVNNYQPPGEYEVSFDASHLASGTYFYQLTSGSFTETKKMQLIK